jgi:hypothetical protein
MFYIRLHFVTESSWYVWHIHSKPDIDTELTKWLIQFSASDALWII